MKNVDWDVVKCLVIAGPGFAKDEFRKYLEAEAVRLNLRCRPSRWRYNDFWTSSLTRLPSPRHTYVGSRWCRPLILNKARLVVAPATTAYKQSLKEVFSAPGIVGQIKVSLAKYLQYNCGSTHWMRKCAQHKPCRQKALLHPAFAVHAAGVACARGM